jgi:ABC-type polar amino acid transport system ATPase subunit
MSVGDNTQVLDQIRKRVGMVFQDFNLFLHLTILGNCVPPKNRALGQDRATATEETEDQLKKMQVDIQPAKFPDQRSVGQQRVALARALCFQPEIMMFDEPISVIDPEMVSKVLDMMQDLARAEITIVCVTHGMGFAGAVADRVILMAAGEIVEEGTPEQMLNNPQHGITREFMKIVNSDA